MSFEFNPVEEDPDGECRHEIHRLKQWVDDLQSGMYVNCVYCGHRYGPGETTPVSMADALKDHVQQCREHPMSALRRDRDRLKAVNDALVKVCEEAIESHYAPDPNCSCHISPPCSDCVEYGGVRETVSQLREALAKAIDL